MDIKTTKLELVKTILNIDNSEFIMKLAEFVNREKSDFWNELSSEQQKEISEGIGQLEKGKRVSYESFLKKIP